MFRTRVIGAACVLILLGSLVAFKVPAYHNKGILAILAGLAIMLVTLAVERQGTRRRGGTQRHIRRWSRRQSKGGTATFFDHHKNTSAFAMRWRFKGGAVLRPELRNQSLAARWTTPLITYATYVGRCGMRKIWVSLEDNILRISGVRSGKSRAMRVRIRKHTGGVVATSTRVDIMATAVHRAAIGKVYVFDSAGIWVGGSMAKWTPLMGCTDPGVAATRAYDMIPEGGSDEGERWCLQARRILSVLMHAAALSGERMQTVVSWLAADGPLIKEAYEAIEDALRHSPAMEAMLTTTQQFYSTGDRTRSSIVVGAMPALAWLTIPEAADIGDCRIDESIDLLDIIDNRSTLYILGKKNGMTSPLTGALTGEVMRLAEITAERRGGRLDPALLISLDEATKVCTGPIHEWSADCGGRGIVLDVATQSIAAITNTWGDNAAKMLIANSNAVLIGAGCKDPDDLMRWEEISGARMERSETFDRVGGMSSWTHSNVPVLSKAQIAGLRKGEAIVYGLGPIMIVKTPKEKRKIFRSRSHLASIGGQDFKSADDELDTIDQEA